MAWIEVHQSLPTHRKTLKMARQLGIPRVYVLGHLVALWLWSLDNIPDGDLKDVSPQDLALAAEWPKAPDLFAQALLAAGFIDQDTSGLHIHDWFDYAGRLVTKRAANAERQRQFRARHITDTALLCARNVTEKYAATVPNPTVPNRTQPVVVIAQNPESDTMTDGDPALAGIVRGYEEIIGEMVTPLVRDLILEWVQAYPMEWVEGALRVTAERRKNGRIPQPGKYVAKILANWQEAGHMETVQPERRPRGKGGGPNRGPSGKDPPLGAGPEYFD